MESNNHRPEACATLDPTPPAYRDYWKRKQLLAAGVPHAPVLRWWDSVSLCESEQAYFEALKDCRSVLDFGAGDLRVMHKLQKAGYRGEYHTLDIGGEYSYTYKDLDQVGRKYEAILCLDVIEHIPLNGGLELLNRLTELLEPGGVLVVQTPNARFIQFPLASDMTHVQCYNASDLWAYLSCSDMAVKPYRVSFGQSPGAVRKVAELWRRFVITRWLGCDFAENILLIGKKQA
jgi:hypothetical protein